MTMLADLRLKEPGELLDEIVALRKAIKEACDLLAERTQGSHARSPGHNARLLLERALRSVPNGERA
ncbi:MAG: hypothetical protein ACYCZX_20970 [Rhodospirillaceae bacterium]